MGGVGGKGRIILETEWMLSLVQFVLQLFDMDKMVQAARNLVRDAPEPHPMHIHG